MVDCDLGCDPRRISKELFPNSWLLGKWCERLPFAFGRVRLGFEKFGIDLRLLRTIFVADNCGPAGVKPAETILVPSLEATRLALLAGKSPRG